jgi:regulation of enolase protein 1 (concanavalin A-like superfamily)
MASQPESLPGPGGPARTNGRPRAGRPELLDEILRHHGSFVTTPGFLAVAAAVLVGYGLVLALVLSQHRAHQPEPERAPALVAAVTPEPLGSAAVAAVPPSAAAKGAPPKAAAAPAPAPAPPLSAAPPPAPAPAQAAPKAPPRPERPDPPAAPPAPAPLVEAPKAEIPKTETPQEPLGPLKEPPGPLLDPSKDCQLTADARGFTLSVPGAVHVLSPELGVKNAPRALAKVEGDFQAEVTISGTMRPDPKPAVEGLPFAFQGAGLLMMHDTKNYLRLERAAAAAHNAPFVHQVLLEVCKDGKPMDQFRLYKDVPEGPIAVRLQRHGREFHCQWKGAGQDWQTLRKFKITFPAKMWVGVSASNTSQQPLLARFEEFALTAAGGASGGPGQP